VWARIADLFPDRDQQLRFEISMAWAMRVSPAEKDDFPLPDFDIGPGFIPAFDRLQGVSHEKVLDVIVDVLTGRAKDTPGRRMHRRRMGSAGGAPVRKRDDGAVSWRVAIQRGTPGARQLHYWEQPSGRIELDQVGVHDEGLL
jgi:hypothetical protein